MQTIHHVDLQGRVVDGPTRGYALIVEGTGAEEWLDDHDDWHHGLAFEMHWPTEDQLQKGRAMQAELDALLAQDLQEQIAGISVSRRWDSIRYDLYAKYAFEDTIWTLHIDKTEAWETAVVVRETLGEREGRPVVGGEPLKIYRRRMEVQLAYKTREREYKDDDFSPYLDAEDLKREREEEEEEEAMEYEYEQKLRALAEEYGR